MSDGIKNPPTSRRPGAPPAGSVTTPTRDQAWLESLLEPVVKHHFGDPLQQKKVPIDAENWVISSLVPSADREIFARTQSRQIKQGNAVEDMVAQLIKAHPKRHRPPDLFGPGCSPASILPGKRPGALYSDQAQQSVVFSRLPSDKVAAEANFIKEAFLKRGATRSFARLTSLIDEAVKRLRAIPSSEYDAEISQYVIDLAEEILDANGNPVELRLTELKSSGKLDSKDVGNALGNTLRARLALLDYRCRIKVFSGQAFGETPTALSKTFPPELFLTGRNLWEHFLPTGLSYEDLKAAWKKVCEEHFRANERQSIQELFKSLDLTEQVVVLSELAKVTAANATAAATTTS